MDQVLKFVEENSKFINASQFKDETRKYEQNKLSAEMMRDVVLRRAYCDAYGLEESMVIDQRTGAFVELPTEVFNEDDDFSYDEMYDPDTGEVNSNHSVLAGNLSSWWDKV